ncbi:MAG: terminase [Rhizobiales bacterium]|nr:terminase [Hyphomicrobiales bacterium]
MLGVASGHGIGKSAAIGMLCNWALSTCDDCKVMVTANTEAQLRTKTSPEVGKWSRLSLTANWFDVESTSISSKDSVHRKTWRADFIPWSENNTEAFAGLHNKGKRIVLIFDEASAIADKVWEVAEGALTDESTEIIWIAFGNPTRNTGRFRECARRLKHRWQFRQIDSRQVEGTNKEQIAKWVQDYGEDSDFVKVRVRGMFPSASSRQFISEVDVSAAYGKELQLHQFDFAPKILTVDPAWEGDDEFVIGLRQGLVFRILHRMAKNDNDLIAAALIARYEDEEKADAVFIDAGFGTGIVSAGQGMGRTWLLVWFASASANQGCLNKRAEMWQAARDWLKAGGCIPDDPVLRDELMAPEVVPRVDGKVQIEAKKDMKARGIPSPNRADALVLSFAFPVFKKDALPAGNKPNARRAYDPYQNV